MENSNQRKTPLFAEVHVNGDGQGGGKRRHNGANRLPYFKLTYPNGTQGWC